MSDAFEVLMRADLILEALQLFGIKFDDSPAPDADEVVMVLPAIGVFIKGMGIEGLDFFQEAAFDEERDRPVERGARNLVFLFLENTVEPLDIKMRCDGCQFPNDGAPLPGEFQPLCLEEISEEFLFHDDFRG